MSGGREILQDGPATASNLTPLSLLLNLMSLLLFPCCLKLKSKLLHAAAVSVFLHSWTDYKPEESRLRIGERKRGRGRPCP